MMMINQQVSPAPVTSFSAGGCNQCGFDDRPFLHHFHLRRKFFRLCTICILRANSRSLCPTCFQIYDNGAPAENPNVTCSKCYSISHSPCVGPNPRKPYICPLCTNRTSPLFDFKKKEIDKKSASALLAATKISRDSISKAAALAKAEAEKAAKKAASARKSAKEAIEHLRCIEENLEEVEFVDK